MNFPITQMRRGTITSILITAMTLGNQSWGASPRVTALLESFAKGDAVEPVGLDAHERTELITRAIAHESPVVRNRAIEMVSSERRKDEYELLMPVLKDRDADIRRLALVTASNIDETRTTSLARDLANDSDVMVRRLAFEILVSADAPGDREAVHRAMKQDHLIVRLGIVLAQLRHEQSIDKAVAREALSADAEWLKKHPVSPGGYLNRGPAEARAAYFLRLIKNDGIEVLNRVGTTDDLPLLDREVSVSVDKVSSAHARETAANIRLRLMPESKRLEFLTSATKDEAPWVRRWSLERLSELPGGIEAVRKIAQTPDHPARSLALRQLRRAHAMP